ncbi:transcriptional regulator [Enterococcus sp. AZ189]|uniref:transcriptional regulator n=1 Tax=Enterococcus sp. AZ189 TaxID=2774871 RepID=UPI003F21CE58
MQPEVRAHIRNLLWNYKKIKKDFENFSNLVSLDNTFFLEYPINNEDSWSLNQIIFHKMFLKTVAEVLGDSTSDVKDIFLSKYKNGFPAKGNDLVAYETFLSESTVKRRDNELLKEIANKLGWLV